MKKLLFIFAILFATLASNAQSIGDVQQSGSWVNIYDSNGSFVSNFSVESSDEVVGFSSSIVVVRKGNSVNSYNVNGKFLGNFYIESDDRVKSVSGNYINVLKGSWLNTYDYNGKFITNRSY